MGITNQKEAEDLIYRSFLRAKDHIPVADDAVTRDIALTRELFTRAGHPERGTRTILVTGSKGKGTTSRMIASILREHGYNVGLFTSPHLLDFRERIRVNGEMISEEDFVHIMKALEKPVLDIDRRLPPEKYLGPIGITLTAALIYFREQKTDINVVECGRGGRYDETNLLANEWAVITPIMSEHIGPLGKDVYTICDHKLGIIKALTSHTVIGHQSENVFRYMQMHDLLKTKSNVYYFDHSLWVSGEKLRLHGLTFHVHTDLAEYRDLTLSTVGRFQADNAATAIKTCETVLGRPLSVKKVRKALRQVNFSGRCEIIDHCPLTILDGTINRASALYLKDIVQHLGAKRVVSIIAVPEDKDYHGVMEVCSQFASRLIITEASRSHKKFPEDALKIAQKYDASSVKITPFTAALREARKFHPDLIFILGTQTFIGEVKKAF